jgi:two-component system sensor histidine kinase ChvG
MALETERTPEAAHGLWEMARVAGGRLANLAAGAAVRAHAALQGAGRWLASLKPVRFVAGSLLRRILVANLAGLLIMVGGILYFSQYHAWLISSKRELLKVQGEILAAAIAGDGKVEPGRLVVDPHRAPAADDPGTAVDEGFAALELSLRPERVAKIIRRMIQPEATRARIYGREGTLIFDSATLLTRGQVSRHEPRVTDGKKPKTKSFWTRLKYWMIDHDLPVYKEIGNANGAAYPEVREALMGRTTAMLLLNEVGEQVVSTAVPIRRGSKVLGVLLISTPPGEIDRILAEEREVIWTLAAIALVAALVTSFLLARTVAEPMRRLSDAANNVSRNINARQELPDYADRTDEVGQMAGAFAAMTAALYRRIEASESFADDVAHELKNPLTAARSTAESLAYAKTEGQRGELVRQIQNELTRLNRLITDVSNASRLDAELARQQMKPVDVTGVVASVVQIFRDILAANSRRVVTLIEPAPFEGAYTVNGNAGRLGQVLTNLIDNAVSFCPEGRTVTLSLKRTDSAVEIMVDDEGPGIPDDRLAIIFDRFYTDRPQTEATRGKNSGLGLSISREIVRAHGGEIWAQNRRGANGAKPQGARFCVRLPALSPTARGGAQSVRRI